MMPDYLPSLAERKRQFLENCCGDMGADNMAAQPEEGNVPTAEDENPQLKKLMDKVRKRKKGSNGA